MTTMAVFVVVIHIHVAVVIIAIITTTTTIVVVITTIIVIEAIVITVVVITVVVIIDIMRISTTTATTAATAAAIIMSAINLQLSTLPLQPSNRVGGHGVRVPVGGMQLPAPCCACGGYRAVCPPVSVTVPVISASSLLSNRWV